MSNLYISEFDGLAATEQSDSVDHLPVAIVDQVLAFTGVATASAAFNKNTKFIEFVADGIMSFLISPTGTLADVTKMRATAGERIRRGVTPGYKISAITNT